jgi:hypothetical protein
MHIYKFFYIKTFKIAPTCFSECILKCDFSKEQRSSLKMILEIDRNMLKRF